MKRFRGRTRREQDLDLGLYLRGERSVGTSPGGWGRELEAQWTALHHVCTDRASRSRLARLLDRLMGGDRAALQSALAELELATLLVRAGFSVGFLPESQSRTADFECTLGQDRMFVEVTALVGSRGRPRGDLRARSQQTDDGDEEDHDGGQVLIDRLVSRISQKARQLVQYRAPVLLAMTVPRRDPSRHRGPDEVDLKRLAGTVTVMLTVVRHVSGVLLSLWEIKPAPARSGVRLANAHVVERPAHQTAYPRVRLLIRNPAAAHPLSGREIEALTGLL